MIFFLFSQDDPAFPLEQMQEKIQSLTETQKQKFQSLLEGRITKEDSRK